MYFDLIFRGVHLKDLILLNTALPDKLHGHLINFRKMAQLSNIFTELMNVQMSTVPVEGNLDLVNMIKVVKEEDWIVISVLCNQIVISIV